ncbi:MAG: bifunctional UDP-N-acetylglucosamine diphosphorylase/glucosamine-1-phosphate N-acetyltransferase GlmU [Desulfohalobiaceae bacterium]|nr:bifunctional UDP-N-acetylglucosamine diphosphorylase/glucosamine-1-phosphate N-acetyltransferase GlmU [Desulfohalobiaceae bacterium]
MLNPFTQQDVERLPDVSALILAAGKGTRMQSDRPKVLQTLLETPMLWYVYQVLDRLISPEKIHTVVGYQQELVRAAFPDREDRFILQAEQLGTGHALQCAFEALVQQGCRWCLVVNGDVPLIRARELRRFVQEAIRREAVVSFLSLELDDPAGYGRVLRNGDGCVRMIVEEKDIGERSAVRDVNEVNSGIYCLDLDRVRPCLDRLENTNVQQEYYITQLVDLGVQDEQPVLAVNAGARAQFLGINTPFELASCEEMLRARIVRQFQEAGVIMHNPDQIRIAPQVEIEAGAEITGPTEVYGRSRIMSRAKLDSHLWIQDSRIGVQAWIRNFSHLEGVIVGDHCQVGPFARLRPDSELRTGAKAGNFVEIKKALLDAGCKVNHLSYIGDATLGQDSNVGAGTITCNYDGYNKHKTSVGKQAFIGSNTSLVAPVSIGENAVVGAGSVVTKDVPDEKLAVSRARQKNLDWKRTRSRNS